jgi:hypothetical protein
MSAKKITGSSWADIVPAADARGRVKAGQRGARLDRLRDRHVIEAGRAERSRFAAVEIGSDDEQRMLELAEVIGAPPLAPETREIGGDCVIVERAVRQPAGEPEEG